jgi:hypothetical protein
VQFVQCNGREISSIEHDQAVDRRDTFAFASDDQRIDLRFGDRRREKREL